MTALSIALQGVMSPPLPLALQGFLDDAAGILISPATGTLVLTGQQAVVTGGGSTNFTLTPVTGALLLSGQVSALGFRISPTTGALVLAGGQPGVQTAFRITPLVGTLTLTGVAPVLTSGSSVLRQPEAGAIVLTGFAPGVGQTVTFDQQLGLVFKVGRRSTTFIVPQRDAVWKVKA